MLRDVTPGHLMEFGEILDPVVLKRSRHVVTENDRVSRSVDALRANDLVQFGNLMYASHASLRDNYEVSCPELDAVVDICSGAEGVYGARMTGAGFGGCAICLVREQNADAVIERLRRDYPARTGKTPGITVCTFEQGVTVSSA
jgi:galactokinase